MDTRNSELERKLSQAIDTLPVYVGAVIDSVRKRYSYYLTEPNIIKNKKKLEEQLENFRKEIEDPQTKNGGGLQLQIHPRTGIITSFEIEALRTLVSDSNPIQNKGETYLALIERAKAKIENYDNLALYLAELAACFSQYKEALVALEQSQPIEAKMFKCKQFESMKGDTSKPTLNEIDAALCGDLQIFSKDITGIDKERYIANLKRWISKEKPSKEVRIALANYLLTVKNHPLKKELSRFRFGFTNKTTSMAIVQGILAQGLDGEDAKELNFEKKYYNTWGSRRAADKAYRNRSNS